MVLGRRRAAGHRRSVGHQDRHAGALLRGSPDASPVDRVGVSAGREPHRLLDALGGFGVDSPLGIDLFGLRLARVDLHIEAIALPAGSGRLVDGTHRCADGGGLK